jgi:hypothetical protein
VYNQYTVKHKHKHKLCLAESDWTRIRPADRVGPARAGSDRDGRERPAADGRAGPFRPERTPFFPSHSVPTGLRSITGRTIQFFPESERTGPPVGGRPHSTVPDTPGARGRRARAVREMTMVSTKAARDRAFPAEIRQSSHCQQEKQSKVAAAVGGHHEKGSTS